MTDFIEFDKETNELNIKVPVEDCQDLVVNKELVLHISKSADGGYIVDLYRHSNWNEEYMFDDDFLTTMCVYEDELMREVTYRMQTDVDNAPIFDDFYMIGSKLYRDEELIGENMSEDDIVKAIKDRVSDRVLSIEIEGEEIYRE